VEAQHLSLFKVQLRQKMQIVLTRHLYVLLVEEVATAEKLQIIIGNGKTETMAPKAITTATLHHKFNPLFSSPHLWES